MGRGTNKSEGRMAKSERSPKTESQNSEPDRSYNSSSAFRTQYYWNYFRSYDAANYEEGSGYAKSTL